MHKLKYLIYLEIRKDKRIGALLSQIKIKESFWLLAPAEDHAAVGVQDEEVDEGLLLLLAADEVGAADV